MHSANKKIQFAVALLFLVSAAIWLGQPAGLRAQNQMEGGGGGGEFSSRPWEPKKGARYAGRAACVKCHTQESATQHATAMGRALEPVATSEVLSSHQRMTFRSGPYQYLLTRQGDKSIYSVTDGVNTISEQVLYSFGQGKAGQTYIFQRNGSFYESRLSFFKEIKGLDFTMGYPATVPPSLDEAAGRAISVDEVRSCFACHSTGAVSGKQLQLERMMPGVSCEACHGPGAEHIEAMEARKFQDKRIFNPGNMSPDDLSQEFCGSCHRSAEQVISNSTFRGVHNVRFQPYRLFTSRGHNPADPRLSCTACHNPHENPRPDPVSYDANCFACHRSGESLKSVPIARTETEQGRTARACPVARQACTTCHMPKIDLPGAHFRFTDHRIRITKAGDPYPN